MLAQHLDHEPAFCSVWPVLYAHIAAIYASLSPTSVVCATLEDRLQCAIVQLASKAVARTGRAVGIEGIADEERTCIKGE
jgi:hypothetical protein